MAPFSALELNATLLRSVEKEGFENPTEIQSQTIPALLEGRDLMGIAQTGGGKTAAFALPLLHRLAEEKRKPNRNAPRAVILAPTRELAIQIGDCLRTFAKGLRALLRQDPDVMMVGEIRDEETARVAIQAALTGHLVFSTLHTNDAPSAITRLIDMGIKPFLVASSIQAVMAQRLIRVLHDGSKELAEPEISST